MPVNAVRRMGTDSRSKCVGPPNCKVRFSCLVRNCADRGLVSLQVAIFAKINDFAKLGNLKWNFRLTAPRRLTMQTVVALVGDGECTLKNCVATFQQPAMPPATETRLALATLLPVAWAGVWVGHRAHLRLASATAARIIAAALFVAGAALVARTL